MDFIFNFVKLVNSILSDYILIFLLVSAGVFFTFITRFVQVRCFKSGIKIFAEGLNGKQSSKKGINSFQALITSIAAQIGVGNIVGVCGAIITGGPGSLVWMWIIAFFSMATIYAEAVLAIKTRKTAKDGSFYGGPVYYIQKAFPKKAGKLMSVFFAFSATIALGFMGSMVQSNAMCSSICTAFGTDIYITSICITICSVFIFLGGIKRIVSVTEKLVPFMAIAYMIGCLAIIIIRIKYIPETVMLIVKYAFKPDAILGGTFGMALKTAVSQGAKRGLFSNEAGMGSTPHAHAATNVKSAHTQGVAAMMGVFIDTFVVLTMTAIAVVSAMYAGGGPLSQNALPISSLGIDKNNMMQICVGSTLSNAYFGNIFVAVCLFLFAFSSIICWNYFGKINAVYLMGKRIVPFYMLASALSVFLGSVMSSDFVWHLADLFANLMVIPNVLSLFVLSKAVKESSLANN